VVWRSDGGRWKDEDAQTGDGGSAATAAGRVVIGNQSTTLAKHAADAQREN